MADDKIPTTSDRQVRLMMWTVPRSTSTVLSKCLSFVEDSKVLFEPFSAALIVGPDRVEYVAPNFVNKEIYDFFLNYSPDDDGGQGFDSSQCSYAWVKEQLEQAHTGKRLVFGKDMAYVMTSHKDSIPRGYRHLLLLRHPLRVFPSWKKIFRFGLEVHTDNYNIEDMPYPVFPTGRGFKELYDLMVHLKEAHDQEAIIIDSDDLLANPKGTLSALFKTIGLPFDETILNWETGNAVSKQWVTSKVLLAGNDIGQYYKNAFDSSCFLKPGGLPDRSSLTPDILRCVDASMPYYDEMYAKRLKPDGS